MLKKYLQALRLSWKDLYTHPIVFLGILALLLGYAVIMNVLIKLNLGVAGGFILSLLEIAAISYYFNWLSLSRAPRGIKLNDLPEFNYNLFVSILNVAFVLFICDLMLRSFGDSELKAVIICVNLLVVICFNALPEIINKHQYQGLTSFSESLDFIKRRWVEWTIPMLLAIIPMLILAPQLGLLEFATSNPLKPFLITLKNYLVFVPFLGLFSIIPLVIFAHWLMLFRRRLYDQL